MPNASSCRNACGFICQPAAPCVAGAVPKISREAVERLLHHLPGPGRVALLHLVLPDPMVPGVDAAFMAGVAHRAHLRGAGLADVGRRQQHAVHQGLQAVVFQHRSARHLAEEAGPKYLAQRPAGVVGAERKQEGGVGLVALQQAHQVRHAFARAAIGVDVDFQGERQSALRSRQSAERSMAALDASDQSISARASATWPR